MLTDLQVLRITNLTNGIDIQKSVPSALIELTEYSDEKISLVIPKTVGKNILVSIETILILDGQKNAFSISGKITDVKSSGEKNYSLEIEMHHYDQDLWAQFRRGRKRSQDKIDDTLKKVRGSE